MDQKKFPWNKKPSGGPEKEDDFFQKFKRGPYKFSFFFFILFLIALIIINSLFQPSEEDLISFNKFKELILIGEIIEVQISDEYHFGEGRNGVVYKTVPVDDPDFISLLDESRITYYAKKESSNYFLGVLLNWMLPLVFMIIIWKILFKRLNSGSNVLSFGQNRSRIIADTDTGVSFKDVAGVEEAKEELVEVVDFLKTPDKYTAIGGKIPKGVLLVGPPGTGKTMLAKAVAKEAGVPFFRMSGADFVEMFVGVGAARVRDLFKQAREKAPCIIFIDELDAIGKSRAAALSTNDEREQTLNMLLVEMDGFDSTTGVILLAATNRPEILDPALLRAGRFDRQILVDKPDLIGREAILNIHSRDVKLGDEVNLKNIAKTTPGFVGSDLANIVNEAALLAVRAGRKKIEQEDFAEAIEKVVAGLKKKNRLINDKERKIVAYHETGHALVAAFTPGSDPVQKISIVPRGFGALGYTLQMPTEDRYLMTRKELISRIDVLLGGRAAEQLIFEEISTGAANDLVKSTDIAKNMITEYGMSEKFRNVTLSKPRGQFIFPGETLPREYSEATQQYVDEEVARIIDERYRHVLTLLKEKIGLLNSISAQLLEEEIIGEDKFKELISEG